MTEDQRRSNHDVYRVTARDIDITPCFCAADRTHRLGQEQEWSAVFPPEGTRDDRG